MSAANAVLTTARLTLEPLKASHADALFAGLSNASLYQYIPQEPPASVEALRERYKRLESRSSPSGDEWWLNWAVRLTDGAYIGRVEATVDEDNKAIVAWFVFAEHQRKGYAKEAVTKLLEHLEGPFMALEYEVFVDTRNAASIGLVESLGFKRAATIPNAQKFKGSTSDEYRYSLIPPSVAKAAKGKKK
ncbi:GNAT family N-acetyltransferase [Chitinimonas sp. BJYL2]|uniref:GNAT family N-acetyltransferase n=1 Tax=Chitinimonas sp. BJYL2 TaxID=2976696 RepID=UPI0022B309FD|nr:GNAT family N-acetyltransferase [Chitinimonas sp. BJYL2]